MRFRRTSWFSADAQRKRWGETRAKGKKHFIIWRGIVLFGGSVFVMQLVNRLIWPPPFLLHSVFYYIVQNLILALLFGSLWGLWMWSILNEKFSTPSQD